MAEEVSQAMAHHPRPPLGRTQSIMLSRTERDQLFAGMDKEKPISITTTTNNNDVTSFDNNAGGGGKGHPAHAASVHSLHSAHGNTCNQPYIQHAFNNHIS